ncbi:MAG: hypothetical protein M0Z50_08470 [Planctomycetia bacterium]|jgi:hypothetical protein|nr:hypothetical protein [Planctomycetia bacterium]
MNEPREQKNRVPEVVMPSDVSEMRVKDACSQKRYTVRRTKKSGGLVMNAADRSVDRLPWQQ